MSNPDLEEYIDELYERLSGLPNLSIDEHRRIVIENPEGIDDMRVYADDLMFIILSEKMSCVFREGQDYRTTILEALDDSNFGVTTPDEAQVLKEVVRSLAVQFPADGKAILDAFTKNPPKPMMRKFDTSPIAVIVSGAVISPEDLTQFHQAIFSSTKNRQRAADITAELVVSKNLGKEVAAIFEQVAAAKKVSPSI